MEVTGVDFLLALKALRQKKLDKDSAIAMLLSKEEKVHDRLPVLAR